MGAESEDSWMVNLRRKGGFFQDADWYSLQLSRKMPLVPKMLEELVFALPPLGSGRVCDLASGNGNAAVPVLKAYPHICLHVIEKCPYRIIQCKNRLKEIGHTIDEEHLCELNFGNSNEEAPTVAPGAPYDAIIGSLAIHSLVGHGAENEAIPTKYKNVFKFVLESLKPGGHFVMGDHVELLPLYRQLKILEEVGFEDIDVAWRQEAYFVAGGRRPKE